MSRRARIVQEEGKVRMEVEMITGVKYPVFPAIILIERAGQRGAGIDAAGITTFGIIDESKTADHTTPH